MRYTKETWTEHGCCRYCSGLWPFWQNRPHEWHQSPRPKCKRRHFGRGDKKKKKAEKAVSVDCDGWKEEVGGKAGSLMGFYMSLG